MLSIFIFEAKSVSREAYLATKVSNNTNWSQSQQDSFGCGNMPADAGTQINSVTQRAGFAAKTATTW